MKIELAAAISGAAGAAAATCSTTTVSDSVPSSGELALQAYSYCGGTLNLTAYIANLDYDKVVTLYYTNRQNESTPLETLELGYNETLASNSDWEIWGLTVPVWVDGITELLNLTYEATDLGDTYDQILNLPVTASGNPAPTLPALPSPYATPTGFGDDITKWLAVTDGSESEIAMKRMFLNVNPDVTGAINGTVVAARSGPSYPSTDPDYEYNWVRDASLTMWVVQKLYAAATDATAKAEYETILFEYAVARATEQTDPNLDTVFGLGEPKFYLNDTIFTGPWARPQNDGPATSAVTLMTFANHYLANGGDKQTIIDKVYNSTAYPDVAPVLKDLLFVANNWSSPTYDLWEEVEAEAQFYDRIVQRRALVVGSAFATTLGDDETASTLAAAEQALTPTLAQFWDVNRQILVYADSPVLDNKTSYLDTAVILGIIHGYAGDGVFNYTNEMSLSTAVRIATCFIDVYPIANKTTNAGGEVLGIPVGRFPEDEYYGTDSKPNGGNPWFLCIAAFAQYMYAASAELSSTGQLAVTDISKAFFDYFAPEADLQAGKTYDSGSAKFDKAIDSLNGWGDAFVRTIKYYAPANGHLTEEINRDTGDVEGAKDLTWSYASLLTAAFARASLRGETEFVEKLANLGVTPNS